MFNKKQAIPEAPITYNKISPISVFVEFQGAACDVDDEGHMMDFVPRGAIVLNLNHICGYYDHTILIAGRKIRVMETCNQISLKIMEASRK